MAADPEEDAALSWAGDEPVKAEPVRRVEVVDATPKASTPAALLVTYGILAGAYLLYTIGWVISIQRLNAVRVASSEPLNAIMFSLDEALAIASPAIWFGSMFLLSRGRKPMIRLLLLLVGLVAVLPWPFVLGAWV